ncbi:hypothetical protein AMATHDRAFT_69833 [Amanita thiersii Skay4041]|uniref:AB hydrolase-1 domain-containing protein n=1 Tax=Amanita thiersii Skay4041 TaxID=703135 RepID=A0A2A9N845_9AGAR|nr:hypothetical protein AMATHDRAFT_69833 [Amanita thiersii Skay4041]
MLSGSFTEYLAIRFSITSLRAVAPISILYLSISAFYGKLLISPWVGFMASVEAIFYLAVYLPRRARLQSPPTYPQPQLSRRQRQATFERCAVELPSLPPPNGPYPMGWLLPHAHPREFKRDNVVEWLLWALFACDKERADLEECGEEINGYIRRIEEMLGRQLEDGRDDEVTSMRLALDPVQILHRPFMWYIIVGIVDAWTSFTLASLGFHHYAPSGWFSTFPPRPILTTFSRPAATHDDVLLPYWYRPHRAKDKLPVLFIHGIGIGLYPYIPFLRELAESQPDVGIILLELLPLSMHMTSASIPPRHEMLKAVEDILESFNIERVVLVAHSYGTFIAGSILRSGLDAHSASQQAPIPQLASKIARVVLVDPIPILLHLPPVAYSFLYREPPPWSIWWRKGLIRDGTKNLNLHTNLNAAGAWQLWYFASRDADVARTLMRSFFWMEGILWREDVDRYIAGDIYPDGTKPHREDGRTVVVVLAGQDQIVPADTVWQYLTGEEVPTPRWVGVACGKSKKGRPNGDIREAGRKLNNMRSTSAAERSCEDTGQVQRLEVLYYDDIDHAQAFDRREVQKDMVELICPLVRI